MALVVLQTFKAADGKYLELARIISEMLVDTAARQGAQAIHAAGDAASGQVTVYELWDGPESLQAYVTWRTSESDVSKLIAVLREPPKIEQLAHLF